MCVILVVMKAILPITPPYSSAAYLVFAAVDETGLLLLPNGAGGGSRGRVSIGGVRGAGQLALRCCNHGLLS